MTVKMVLIDQPNSFFSALCHRENKSVSYWQPAHWANEPGSSPEHHKVFTKAVIKINEWNVEWTWQSKATRMEI